MAAPTTILDLGDDLLLGEVFHRLPSLRSLVRAALACPAFLRAVRSSPSFRRRFIALHTPILGAFLLDTKTPSIPTFMPIRRRSDSDHAAALRVLDAFLTRLPDAAAIGDKKDDGEEDDDGPEWSMIGCGDGYLIFVTPRRKTKKVAIYNPLTGAMHLFPEPPDEVLTGKTEYYVVPHSGVDKKQPFRLLCVSKKDPRVVAVASPDSVGWQITPTGGERRILKDAEGGGTLANGSVYWSNCFHALDTKTMRFERINLPGNVTESAIRENQSIRDRFFCDAGGETRDGNTCLVAEDCFHLHVWVGKATDGVVQWTPQFYDLVDQMEALDLDPADEFTRLTVRAVSHGTFYMAYREGQPPSYSTCLLSYCLETGELRKLCPIVPASTKQCYPYIMAWPPSFVRNN